MEREIGEKGRRVRGKIVDSVVRPKVLSSSLLFVVLTAIKEPSLILSPTCYLTHFLQPSRNHHSSYHPLVISLIHSLSVAYFLSHSHTSLTDWLHYIRWQINCFTHPHRLTDYIIFTDRLTASLNLIDWLTKFYLLTDKPLHSPIDPPTTLTTFSSTFTDFFFL